MFAWSEVGVHELGMNMGEKATWHSLTMIKPGNWVQREVGLCYHNTTNTILTLNHLCRNSLLNIRTAVFVAHGVRFLG